MKTETPDPARSLVELIAGFGSCAVAFSGGVDSAVVAKAAQLALGPAAVAVTGRSASLASGELEAASHLAGLIGIRHVVVDTGEVGTGRLRGQRTRPLLPLQDRALYAARIAGRRTGHGDDRQRRQHRRSGRLPARHAGGGRTSRPQPAWPSVVWTKPRSGGWPWRGSCRCGTSRPCLA